MDIPFSMSNGANMASSRIMVNKQKVQLLDGINFAYRLRLSFIMCLETYLCV